MDFAFQDLFTTANLLALLTLTLLEIVLGIDNIVVIAIITGRLEKSRQPFARRLGLSLAMVTRILLLLSLSWIMSLTHPLFRALNHDISIRDLILIVGGLFLIAKATHEIHAKIEGGEDITGASAAPSIHSAIAQILALDLVFSLDSVITAIGMAREVTVMIAAIVIAVIIMMIFAGMISDFIHHHPTIKILALAFLLMIGLVLVLEGLGKHVEKGYIYFAMGFSLLVEMLNLRLHKKSIPAPKS